MGFGAAMGSMGFAWIVGAAERTGGWLTAALSLAIFFVAAFFAAFLATFVAVFFTAFLAAFLATFFAGVFFTAAFLAALTGFARLPVAESAWESSVLFLLIRSMFGKGLWW